MIVISFDDLAWNAFGCYGNAFHETPHIDSLADRGLRFTQAYAAGPVCSPTRAALMTGLYPARTGITDFLRAEQAPGKQFLAPRFRTLPEHIDQPGYRSALIGKWHLTEDYSGRYRTRQGNPYAHGFDDVLLSEEEYIGNGDYFFPYSFMPSVTRGRRGEYLTDRIGADAANWIRRNAARPFFLHISNYAVHKNWRAREDLIRKYHRKKNRDPQFSSNRYRPALAAMIERCDHQVGRVVSALADAGIAANTLILITSDNGGSVPMSNRPLRGGKGSLHEGGIRVPLVAYWPGTVPAGTTSDAVVSTVDICPTVKDLAGGGAGGGMDGVSLAGVLTRQEALTREAYWYYPHFFTDSVPSAAIRSGRYKLVKRLRDGSIELYDIAEDPGEHTNLTERKPLVARRLHRKLRRHIREMRRVPRAPRARAFPVRVAEGEIARRDPDDEAPRQLPHLPPSPDFALVVESGFAQQREGSGRRRHGHRPRASVGLVKDADNYFRVTYDHYRRSVDWNLVTRGVDRRGEGEPEPLNALEGTVDLSGTRARLGVSVSGTTVGVYADQGTGWEFLFLVEIGEAVALDDPEVRAEWGYDLAVGLSDGSHAPGRYAVRRR